MIVAVMVAASVPGWVGPALLTVFLLVLFPIGIGLSGAIVAALHGHFGTKDAEARYEGSELLELSKPTKR